MPEDRIPAMLVIASAITLAVSLFLPWYGLVAHTPFGTLSGSATPWHATSKVAATLFGIAAVALVLGVSGARTPRTIGLSHGHLQLLGIAAVVLVGFRLWAGPYDGAYVGGSQGPIRHVGVFIALLAAVGLLLGARLARRPRPVAARGGSAAAP